MPGVGHISTLSVYLVAAAGAGDDDTPLPSGYAAHRAAAGAGEVPVLLVHPLLAASGDASAHRPPDLLHEPCVLPAPLLQIPGKHPEQRPDARLMTLYTAGWLSRRNILMRFSRIAAHSMVSPSLSTPLRPYMKRDSALPMRCRKFIAPSLCVLRSCRRFSDTIFYRKSRQR